MVATASDRDPSNVHQALIEDQFTRQAELFAGASVLHDSAALDALVRAAAPDLNDRTLDVACGPGTVVAAFSKHVRHAVGLDATDAMLEQARKLSSARSLTNVSWQRGDVAALPFENATFDVVSCRFAVHHFEDPAQAFAEMVRVCRQGGRLVVCDAVASDDPAKATAFNAMERLRDPSTAEFRTLSFLVNLFRDAGLPVPTRTFYQVQVETEALLKVSFPDRDDHERVRAMIRDSVEGDKMGVNAREQDGRILFDYPSVILAAPKP